MIALGDSLGRLLCGNLGREDFEPGTKRLCVAYEKRKRKEREYTDTIIFIFRLPHEGVFAVQQATSQHLAKETTGMAED